MSQTGIFNGRVLVPYAYGCYGYTRGGGKTWHGGIDLVGADDPTILMPYFYYANGDPKEISGTVVTARKVDRSTGNQTWEWGWYVCVKLDAAQTPDAVNYLYFCHCACLLVKVGQKVKSGDALAIMGNTGNAVYNVPPYKHCHLEARATSTGRGLDPTAYAGVPNAAGTYGSAEEEQPGLQLLTVGPVDNAGAMILWGIANKLGLGYDAQYTDDTRTAQVLTIGPASAGDAMTVWAKAQELGAPYKSEYVEG
ncbi:M23 family metallopeptidase [Subdoligranulum variabile]|uniref:M23 family metallopeptidase n=1 Tax=Subdoligranulum variabile TaxID=214851 RepID=UPI0026EE01D2|nr:peptidoglycan DD-metalloendopeptidase family protein [Subdoligranulum variabile]